MPIGEKTTPTIQIAQEPFKEYYATCFWHLRLDLIVTEAMISLVIKSLGAFGDRHASGDSKSEQKFRKTFAFLPIW